jgi:(2S)-methylsuccinyl-CoA dehydrogenase
MTDHLDHARTLIEALERVVATASAHLAAEVSVDGRVATSRIDERGTVCYDLATFASTVRAGRALVDQAAELGGGDQATLALVFAADTYADAFARMTGRWDDWGVAPTPAGLLEGDVLTAVMHGRATDVLESVADRVLATGEAGDRALGEELSMVRDAFRRFAEDRVMPVAEHVHRDDADIPDEIIEGLAEMGCFALSIPTDHGGMADGGPDELLNMVVVTEELSRGSLGVAGSLITRPEIIGTAIRKGGTDEQKDRWLPAIAAGEKMCAVAVTEPDYGSDVASLKCTATRDGDDWVLNGVKTWCTFAGRAEYLLVLARTDPDRSRGHRGLSLFVVDKPRFAGHEWAVDQDGGGRMEARAIPTLGYRGMHSFEVSIDGWRVPHANLIGEDDGLGQGFYLQMQAFANARLQTTARALGVMQAALDEAVAYSHQREVFGTALGNYALTKAKLARMAALIAANRAFAFEVARMLADGTGQLEASMGKQLSCRVAEWVTREAQQLHGGYGYAEEYTVSRLFVDARVLSIFEGADEVLALRVIARQLLADA